MRCANGCARRANEFATTTLSPYPLSPTPLPNGRGVFFMGFSSRFWSRASWIDSPPPCAYSTRDARAQKESASMNEDELDKELPSLDDELESDDERLSAAAAAAAALITGAANTASALWSVLARRAAAESSESDELDSLIGAEDEPDATAEAHSPLGGDGGE